MQANSFSSPALPKRYEAFSNIGFCLLQQPFSQIVVNLGRRQRSPSGETLQKSQVRSDRRSLSVDPSAGSSECSSISRTSFNA